MKTPSPSPTHEEIAQCAREIWKSRHCPSGCDDEIWFEAEGKLKDRSARSDSPSHGAAEPKAPAPSPDDLAAKAALQMKAARAPQLQHGKNAPKPMPAESGKPLWDKPHSS